MSGRSAIGHDHFLESLNKPDIECVQFVGLLSHCQVRPEQQEIQLFHNGQPIILAGKQGNLPVRVASGHADSAARMGTGKGGAAGYRRSLDWEPGELGVHSPIATKMLVSRSRDRDTIPLLTLCK